MPHTVIKENLKEQELIRLMQSTVTVSNGWDTADENESTD
jgi:hypothetical protein